MIAYIVVGCVIGGGIAAIIVAFISAQFLLQLGLLAMRLRGMFVLAECLIVCG